jgi:pre-peptidase
MKRLSRGMVVLAASVVLWSCSGDPTSSFRGSAEEITATPTALFVTRGTSKSVIAEVVDAQGNPLDMEITPSGGTGITVALDPNYLPTTATTGGLTYAKQFIVTATDLVSTSFTLSAGGKTRDVGVKVVPGAADIPFATVASTGPNASDPTVLTVPAPYQFTPDSTVTFDKGTAIVIDRAVDGRSITILPPPGATSAGTASVVTDYLTTVPLATTTDVALTINAAVPATPGTNSPATAPVINIPAPGGLGGFYDGGSFGAATCAGNSGIPCQLYKFTLAADATFNVTMGWSNQADLGLYFLTADGTTDTDQHCDDNGRGATAQPEACTITLPAGTYLAGVVNFGPLYTPAQGGPDPNPAWISIALSTPAP